MSAAPDAKEKEEKKEKDGLIAGLMHSFDGWPAAATMTIAAQCATGGRMSWWQMALAAFALRDAFTDGDREMSMAGRVGLSMVFGMAAARMTGSTGVGFAVGALSLMFAEHIGNGLRDAAAFTEKKLAPGPAPG